MSTKAELAEVIFDQTAGPAHGSTQSSTQQALADLGLLHVPLYVLSAREYVDMSDIFTCSTMEMGSLGNMQMRSGLQRVQLRIELVNDHGHRVELDVVRLHAAMSDTPFRAELQSRNLSAKQIRCRFAAPLFSVWSIDGNGLISIQTDPSIDFNREPILQVLLTFELIMQQIAKVIRLNGVRFQLAGQPAMSGFCAFRGARLPLPALHHFLAHDHARSVDLYDATQFWCASTTDQSLRMQRVLGETHPARKLFQSGDGLAMPRVALQAGTSAFFRVVELDSMARLRALAMRLHHAASLVRVADYTLAKIVRVMRDRVGREEEEEEASDGLASSDARLVQVAKPVLLDQEPALASAAYTPLEYRMDLLDEAVASTQQWTARALGAALDATCLADPGHSHDMSHRKERAETRAAQLRAGTAPHLLCELARPTCIGHLVLWELEETGADAATEFAKLWASTESHWAQVGSHADPIECAQVGCDRSQGEPAQTFSIVYE